MTLSIFFNRIQNAVDSQLREVLKRALVSFILKASGAALNFAFSVVLARKLGAGGTGVFFLALTIISICSTLSRVGLDNIVLRFTAMYTIENNWAAIQGLYKKSILLVLTIALCFIVLIYFSSPILAGTFFKEPALAGPLQIFCLMIAPHAFYWLQSEFFKGLQKIALSQFIQGTSLPLLALLGTLFFARSNSVEDVIIVYIVAASTTSIIGYLLWKKVTPVISCRSGNVTTFNKEIVKSSSNLYLVSIVNLILTWAATIFLGIWGTSSEVGLYSVALRTATLISFILLAINSVTSPKFAILYKLNDMKGLARLVQQSTTLTTIAALPLLALCLIWPERVLQIFGNQFNEGIFILRVVALGQFVNVITGSVGYLLMMSGNEKFYRNCQVSAALLCIVFCIVLIPTYRTSGAAIVSAITLSFSNIYAAFWVWKKLNIITLPSIGIFFSR